MSAVGGFRQACRVVSRIGRDVLDLLLPRCCVVCDRVHDRADVLCGSCDQRLAQLNAAGRCIACAHPLPDPNQPCGWCSGTGIRPFWRVSRIGVYEEPLRTLILRLKFQGMWWLGKPLARRLASRDDVAELLDWAEVICPIPLHPLRQIVRGYDQALELARHLPRQKGSRLAFPLARVRLTQSQSLQPSRSARARNLKDAFALVNPSAVRGRRVLLVDDVMTSAATSRSAARALRPAGPAQVSCVVLALADWRGGSFERR